MRRIISILLSAILLVTITPFSALATTSSNDTSNVIYFDDGSYLISELSYTGAKASNTTSGSRTTTYYNNSDEAQWQVTLSGTFTYNGASATCTSSSCEVNIINTKWHIVSKSATKSSNTANCDVTMGYKFLGITTTKKTASMSITCDANGNLS